MPNTVRTAHSSRLSLLGSLTIPLLSCCGAIPPALPDQVKDASGQQGFRAALPPANSQSPGASEIKHHGPNVNVQEPLHSSQTPSLLMPPPVQLGAPLQFTANNRTELQHSMLDPTVRIEGKNSFGSGTIIYCSPFPDLNSHTRLVLVLTARHTVVTVRDDLEPNAPISVIVHAGKSNEITISGREFFRAKDGDASVLYCLTEEELPVARFVPTESVQLVEELEPLALSGCPQGLPPILTFGQIALTRKTHSKANLIQDLVATNDVFFGNSGGGAYLVQPNGEGLLLGVLTKLVVPTKSSDSSTPPSASPPADLRVINHLSFIVDRTRIDAMMEGTGVAVGANGYVEVKNSQFVSTAIYAPLNDH